MIPVAGFCENVN